jgi:hypothetical protein
LEPYLLQLDSHLWNHVPLGSTIAEPGSSGMKLEGYAEIHSTLLHATSSKNNLLDLGKCSKGHHDSLLKEMHAP